MTSTHTAASRSDIPPVAPGPRRRALERTTAMRLAAAENIRFLDQLRQLEPADWAKPTDCPAWDVRSLVGHVVGMAEMAASLVEQRRQIRAAARSGGVFIDALTSLQVAKHADDTPGQLVDRYAVVGPKAAKARRRTPGFVRNRRMPQPQAVGGVEESWTVGYLVDVILTRDTWMHRMDIALATSRPPQLTPDHDGVLLTDVVAEWAQRHGRPCALSLTGPAGGHWSFGTGGGPGVTADAVDFARALSGRGDAPFGTEVPF
jgi:uncharacterized protein (TIGR03083 family)